MYICAFLLIMQSEKLSQFGSVEVYTIFDTLHNGLYYINSLRKWSSMISDY